MRILESKVELHRPYNNAWSHLLQYRISGLRRQCLLICQRCGKLLHKSDLNSVIKILTLQPCMETIFCWTIAMETQGCNLPDAKEAASIPCTGLIRAKPGFTTLLPQNYLKKLRFHGQTDLGEAAFMHRWRPAGSNSRIPTR
jgi:hypothetical protein